MQTSPGITILLVEDNPDHAEFTLKVLADGTDTNRTYWVKDGEEALDCFREIPVIMLTTSAKPAEVTASYRAGANSFVTKPVKFAQFVDHIKSLRQYWTLTSQLPAA